MSKSEESDKTFPREDSGATWGSPAEAISEMIDRVKARLRNGNSDSKSS
jgi:hypothetical protein